MKLKNLIEHLQWYERQHGDREVAFVTEVYYKEISDDVTQEMVWRTPEHVYVDPESFIAPNGGEPKQIVRIFLGDFTADPYKTIEHLSEDDYA